MIADTVVQSFSSHSSSDRNVRLVVIGGANSGKTSLAFRTAYDIAVAGGWPLYICNQAKLESKLPLEVRCGDGGSADTSAQKMSADILSRIQMKYVTSMNELKAVISSLHAFTPSPTTVIIDDLSLLIDPLHSVQRNDPKFLEICFVLGAYMDDVLKFLHTTRSENTNTRASNALRLQLVITDTCEESSYLQVLQRTAPNVLKLEKLDAAGTLGYSLVRTRAGTFKVGRQNDNAVILPKIELYQGSLLVHK